MEELTELNLKKTLLQLELDETSLELVQEVNRIVNLSDHFYHTDEALGGIYSAFKLYLNKDINNIKLAIENPILAGPEGGLHLNIISLNRLTRLLLKHLNIKDGEEARMI